MAANAANDGSGRCQPKFVSDDEYREMVIRNHPTPRARPIVALTLLSKERKKGQWRLQDERRPSIGYMRIIIILLVLNSFSFEAIAWGLMVTGPRSSSGTL